MFVALCVSVIKTNHKCPKIFAWILMNEQSICCKWLYFYRVHIGYEDRIVNWKWHNFNLAFGCLVWWLSESRVREGNECIYVSCVNIALTMPAIIAGRKRIKWNLIIQYAHKRDINKRKRSSCSRWRLENEREWMNGRAIGQTNERTNERLLAHIPFLCDSVYLLPSQSFAICMRFGGGLVIVATKISFWYEICCQ